MEGLERALGVPDPAAVSPSRAARRRERLERLQSALDGLPPDYRAALWLARIEGLKTSEIAERMNRSPDAVKHLLARGLAQLKRRFGSTDSLRLPDTSLHPRTAQDGPREVDG